MTQVESPVHLILGGSGGIGGALARRLAERGARLVLAARDPGRLAVLAAATGAHTVSLDATDFAQVEAAARDAVARHGRLDGVACCIGSIVLKPAHLTSAADWQAVVTTNLTSAFAAVRAAAIAIPGPGAVALVSTAAARVGLPNHEAIAAAKAGVIGLARSAAATYAGRGLRVNVVAPGLVRTPLSARITGNPAALAASVAMHPLGRIGEPDEVAAALEWLLDPAQGWITGQVLGVDGGLADLKAR